MELTFLSCYTFTVLLALSALRRYAKNPTLQPQNPWLLHFLTFWPPHLEQSHPRHQAICFSLFLQKPTEDISLLTIFWLSHTVLRSYQSVQCVCVCVYILHSYAWNLVDIFFFCGGGGGGIAFSISMYIMCVCLFSALSRRVGALQMPIIIIIITGPNLFQFTRLCSVWTKISLSKKNPDLL